MLASMEHKHHCDVVGPQELAKRVSRPTNTIHIWRKREVLPGERWLISNVPLWCWSEDIVPWLRSNPRRAKPPWPVD